MGANKSPESTYAKVISQIKLNQAKKSEAVATSESSSTSHHIVEADIHTSLPDLRLIETSPAKSQKICKAKGEAT